ncbi:hypothetical protein PUN28_004779 [Cardiocondyla obscurior]|uniref:Uncharacterized protein n=1 Tax=Cardiocondyla obscurior TaxID=286306 RepID=A0AAW2GFJ1_9HYME
MHNLSCISRWCVSPGREENKRSYRETGGKEAGRESNNHGRAEASGMLIRQRRRRWRWRRVSLCGGGGTGGGGSGCSGEAQHPRGVRGRTCCLVRRAGAGRRRRRRQAAPSESHPGRSSGASVSQPTLRETR